MSIYKNIFRVLVLFGAIHLGACGGSGGSSAMSEDPLTEDVIEDPIDDPAEDPEEVAAVFYSLPSDYSVTPVEDQNCEVSDLGGVENVYTEAASKFFTWITGTVEQAHYEPIGEVANYFGFAALRNEIRDSFGEGADEGFRGAASREVLELLDEQQRALMYELLDEHRNAINGFLDDRVLLVDELWALKDDQELDYDRVAELMISVGQYEGEITVITAQKYAEIMATLTPDQIQYLEDMRTLAVSIEEMDSAELMPNGPDANAEFALLNDEDAEFMAEVTSKIVSWATGTLEDSHYLPTGKIGNFFGFSSYRYVDRAGVSRGDAAGFVDAVVTPDQQAILCGLSTNVVEYTNDYIEGREVLISDLDPLKTDPFLPIASLDTDYANLAGVGEGRRAVVEALTFHLIESMMSEEQIQQLMDLR